MLKKNVMLKKFEQERFRSKKRSIRRHSIFSEMKKGTKLVSFSLEGEKSLTCHQGKRIYEEEKKKDRKSMRERGIL